MKKTLTSILVLIVAMSASANGLYEQLCDFNYNWKKYSEKAPENAAIDFDTDGELVATHLKHVLEILRSNSTKGMTEQQLKSRIKLIQELDKYRLAGEFPQNYYREERIPVFIDEHNTHCAVGYLMRVSGHEDLAQAIAKRNNYAWVKEIDMPGVLRWQKQSGLTLEELKLIQGAYDYYMPRALQAPNKTELPQKPIVTLMHFDNMPKKISEIDQEKYVWLLGEGTNGVLNGRWIQNYGVDKPWIVGWYENGQRTGQWKEYYQGTDKLCRTENWSNDKLNGIRKRFDKKGELIEEIMFKDGKAVTKINYDLRSQIKYIRRPLDSGIVDTEVYTLGGALLATGKAKIHNPANLEWFQDIQLTALNSASITSRNAVKGYDVGFDPNAGANGNFQPIFGAKRNNQPQLVQYKKLDNWTYYKNYDYERSKMPALSLKQKINRDYGFYSNEIFNSLKHYSELKIESSYDSIRIVYQDNHPLAFHGYEANSTTNLQIRYYDKNEAASILGSNRISDVLRIEDFTYQRRGVDQFVIQEFEYIPVVKEIGLCDATGSRIGEWKHFDRRGVHYKNETYIIPWKEEENLSNTTSMVQIKRSEQ